MNTINAILTTSSGVVLAPVRSWSPVLVLLLVSAVCGVLMTLVFKHTSNQKALKRVADRTKAQMLCMRIFKDDIRVALRCQRDLLRYIGLRLWYSVPPMLVLLVPFVLILTQLALRYEKRPLEPGETVVASVQIDPEQWSDFENDVSLAVPSGVRIETPGLRDAADHAVYWRLRLEEPTDQPLVFNVGYYSQEKSFVGAEDGRALRTVSARKPGPGFFDRLLFPGEAGFASDWPILGIDLRYPARSTAILGVDIPWWLTFFAVAMIAALLSKPFVKVQF